MIRRKRSLSQDDEDHEEGDDDDEYIPHKDERAYPGQQYQSDASMGRGNERDVHRFGATSASAGTGGRKPQKSVVLGPDGQPPPKKKRRRQALSCTGGCLSATFSLYTYENRTLTADCRFNCALTLLCVFMPVNSAHPLSTRGRQPILRTPYITLDSLPFVFVYCFP